jgi:hypothetical protein
MGGVYGEFLAYFSELFEDFKVYKQIPKVASGYALEYSRAVTGIRQSDGVYVIQKNRKHTANTMGIGAAYTLWTYERIDPATEFVEIDGRMFRPMKSPDFSREGGFWETALEAVEGNDGSQNDNMELAGGTF